MSVYVGKSGSKKEVSSIYIGKSGKREVSEAYTCKSGSIKQVFSSVEPGQQIFTESGTFTVPKGVRKVDIFLVGGGGGSGCIWSNSFGDRNRIHSGGGGGGGYTKTVRYISVSPGSTYSIVIGSGGIGGKSYINYNGGSSSGFGYSSSGGWSNVRYDKDGNDLPNRGNGGSGGGAGCSLVITSYNNTLNYSGEEGGSDGSSCKYGGAGQGSTTRAFGESSGTLYAGGGGGGGYRYDYGTGITGWYGSGGEGGGGHGALYWSNYKDIVTYCDGIPDAGAYGTGGGAGGTIEYYTVEYGGSGCVIIRWGY